MRFLFGMVLGALVGCDQQLEQQNEQDVEVSDVEGLFRDVIRC